MGAPSISLKNIIEKVKINVDRGALANGIQFYIPTLSTTLASFVLFGLLSGYNVVDLNVAEAIIISAVILSLLASACIQAVVYKLVDDAVVSDNSENAVSRVGRILLPATLIAVLLAIILSAAVYPYLEYALRLNLVEYFSCVILTVLYSITWVLLSAVWASGQNKQPAIVFSLSYFTVLLLGYNLAAMEIRYVVWGYIGGISILAISLLVACSKLFKNTKQTETWREVFRHLRSLFRKSSWAMVFQTFFVLALFLDKIIVWVEEGIKNGTGLQVISPYTTGSFLGFVPTLSLILSAYYSEKLKKTTKGIYGGTLKDIQTHTKQYKSLYWAGLSTMFVVGLLVLLAVVLYASQVIGDPLVTNVTVTIGAGVILFQTIVSNSSVLSVFNKSHISAISMLVVCICEGLCILLVPYSVWYESLGFFVGSLLGLIISHIATLKLITRFEYSAFRTFQQMS